jgi:hypothetical protein
LTLAVATVGYAATSSNPSFFWAVVGGFSLAIAFVGGATALVLWRQRRPQKPEPQPLTAERLLAIRHRFFWRNSLLFAFGMPAFFAYQYWQGFGHDPIFLVMICVVSFAADWVWSWFMWQWYGESLKANEKARLRRERENAV